MLINPRDIKKVAPEPPAPEIVPNQPETQPQQNETQVQFD